MSEQMTEQTALALLRRGDEAGLRWMIRRYTPYVGAVVWGIVGGRLTAQDAEEITADAFMELWRCRDRLQDGKVKSYLGTVARRRAIDRLRQAGLTQPLPYNDLTAAAGTAEREVMLREGKRLLRRFLETMKPRDREIFLRYYYLGENAPAIARRLGMTAGAVRQRLCRGRDYLRGLFEEEWTK